MTRKIGKQPALASFSGRVQVHTIYHTFPQDVMPIVNMAKKLKTSPHMKGDDSHGLS